MNSSETVLFFMLFEEEEGVEGRLDVIDGFLDALGELSVLPCSVEGWFSRWLQGCAGFY